MIFDENFLIKLKRLCLEFDRKSEAYPEHDYEGFALYYFATHPECELNPAYGNKIDTEFSEGGEAYLKELEEGEKKQDETENNSENQCKHQNTRRIDQANFGIPGVYEITICLQCNTIINTKKI